MAKVKHSANQQIRGWARTGRIAAALACAALCPVLAAGCSSSSSSGTPPAATTTVTVTSSAAATATSASASPSAAAACATTALKITQSAPNGAAGHFYLTLVFTNTSSAPCTLYGYPGVSLVTGAQTADRPGRQAIRHLVQAGHAGPRRDRPTPCCRSSTR